MNFEHIEGQEPINQEMLQAAHPTFPIQDNFGRMAVSFGMSKLEFAASLLAVGWWSNPNLRRDTIAEEAVNMAAAVLNECQKREKESQPAKSLLDGTK